MKKIFFPFLLSAFAVACIFCGCNTIDQTASGSEQSSFSQTSINSSSENSSLESVTDSSEESSLEDSSLAYSSSEESSSEESISEESSSEESSSEESSSEESSSEEDPPLILETGDLATGGHVGSRAPENYGTNYTPVLQSDVVSENSDTALMGTFNGIGAPVYAGYMIWTWAEFRLADHFGEAQNLKNQAFTYDVKTENCGRYSSVILVSSEGNRTNEVAYDLTTPSTDGVSITVQPLDNGWTRISIDFFMVYFSDPNVETVSEILIMFSNENCDGTKDSVFYIDNAKLTEIESSDEVSDVVVYNPDGYYSKSQNVQIKIVGNSFVSPSTSNSAYYLQLFGETMGANLSVDCISIPNGRIPDQYAKAFGANGYMAKEHVDVLFIQDFYSASDAMALGEFLTELYTVSPTTELKIYAGENETSDGIRAASYYGVDLVDWRQAIKTLKADYEFTSTHLNANDGWHPNALSGFVGGLMMYMELYGECPDFEIVKTLAQEVWSYIPGADDIAKEANLDNIYSVAKSFALKD